MCQNVPLLRGVKSRTPFSNRCSACQNDGCQNFQDLQPSSDRNALPSRLEELKIAASSHPSDVSPSFRSTQLIVLSCLFTPFLLFLNLALLENSGNDPSFAIHSQTGIASPRWPAPGGLVTLPLSGPPVVSKDRRCKLVSSLVDAVVRHARLPRGFRADTIAAYYLFSFQLFAQLQRHLGRHSLAVLSLSHRFPRRPRIEDPGRGNSAMSKSKSDLRQRTSTGWSGQHHT